MWKNLVLGFFLLVFVSACGNGSSSSSSGAANATVGGFLFGSKPTNALPFSEECFVDVELELVTGVEKKLIFQLYYATRVVEQRPQDDPSLPLLDFTTQIMLGGKILEVEVTRTQTALGYEWFVPEQSPPLGEASGVVYYLRVDLADKPQCRWGTPYRAIWYSDVAGGRADRFEAPWVSYGEIVPTFGVEVIGQPVD